MDYSNEFINKASLLINTDQDRVFIKKIHKYKWLYKKHVSM